MSEAIPVRTGPTDRPAGGNPFLAPDAGIRSLNRVRVAALPDAPGGPALAGRSAFELLSAAAVRALVLEATGPLWPDPAPADVLPAFDRCFDRAATRPAAMAVAREVGRRLAALLLTLKRGHPPSRAARPDWTEEHWAFWAGIRRVIVGGGLLAGRLGEAAVAEAGATLARAGCELALERSPFGSAIALVGLARFAPAGATGAVLFDFGQTAVKRGTAFYQDGKLAAIALRPPLPAPCEAAGAPARDPEEARRRWRRMAGRIEADWASAVSPATRATTAIGLSLAAHLAAGHPLDADRGCYARLHDLAPHLATFMRDELARSLGRFHSFTLLHDGLAAAAACAGQPHTAVLVFGTAIGAGYPPPAGDLRPPAPGFRLRAP